RRSPRQARAASCGSGKHALLLPSCSRVCPCVRAGAARTANPPNRETRPDPTRLCRRHRVSPSQLREVSARDVTRTAAADNAGFPQSRLGFPAGVMWLFVPTASGCRQCPNAYRPPGAVPMAAMSVLTTTDIAADPAVDPGEMPGYAGVWRDLRAVARRIGSRPGSGASCAAILDLRAGPRAAERSCRASMTTHDPEVL